MNMTRGWLSIALACAFGALIGTLTALEISTRFEYGSYLWTIGALVGGITAYVAIDFRHFCACVAHSYRRTIAWRPYGLWWRAFGSAFVVAAAVVPTIMTGIVILFGTLISFDRTVPEYTLMGVFVYTPLAITPLAIIAFSIIVMLFMGTLIGLAETIRHGQEQEKWAERLHSTIEMNWSMARIGNPVAVVVIAMRYALRGLRYSIVHSPDAARATRSTVKNICNIIAIFVAGVFVYVHSQRRMICFVDATIGAAIGYAFGSAIIGAIAGALLGVLNYEIVSVRLLRLVPSSR